MLIRWRVPACGILILKSYNYFRSHPAKPEHAQLGFRALNCYTYFRRAEPYMTQFKDKSARYAENINAGLFDYPVPSGGRHPVVPNQSGAGRLEDQKLASELSRDIAQRFKRCKWRYFQSTGNRCLKIRRVCDVAAGAISAKCPKSDDNRNNVIALLEDPEIGSEENQTCGHWDLTSRR